MGIPQVKKKHLLHEFHNSNLLYEVCRTRFLEHYERSEECYKANKCDKMVYKRSVTQYLFYFAPNLNFKLKKVQNIMLGKLI
jgi:hypothetical protein